MSKSDVYSVTFTPEDQKTVPGRNPKMPFRRWLARARQIMMGELSIRMIDTVTIAQNGSVKTNGEIISILNGLIVEDESINEMELYAEAPRHELLEVTSDMFDPQGFVSGVPLTILPPGEVLDMRVTIGWCQGRLSQRSLCTPVLAVRFRELAGSKDFIFEYEVKPGSKSPEELYYQMLDIIQQYPPGTDLPQPQEERVVAASSSTLNPKY